MKLAIKSDFLDYYDHWFDIRDGAIPEFRRFAKYDEYFANRSQMFEYMSGIGLIVPEYGIVSEMELDSSVYVVVHTEDNAHMGENKELLYLYDAKSKYIDKFCTRYLCEDIFVRGVSYRFLCIGNENYFWLKYSSDNDWKSNCGDEVSIEIIKTDTDEKIENICLNTVNIPLFAIDFVKYHDTLYAIDFNSAPQIKGTGVEYVLSGKDVVDSIKNMMKKIN